MKTFFLCIALLLAPAGYLHAQAPDAPAIQLALNEGLDREFPTFQEYADLQIIKGGQTQDGDFLFLCSGRLMWKLSSTELSTMLQQEIDAKRPEPGQDDSLWRAVTLTLSAKLTRIGQFQAGDTVTKLRFLVRLEPAGVDLIVTDARIKASESNPLYIIDKGTR